MVPLLLEEDYVPDGWLGALTGMLKYFKFLSDEQVYTNLSDLVGELGDRGKVGSKASKYHSYIVRVLLVIIVEFHCFIGHVL